MAKKLTRLFLLLTFLCLPVTVSAFFPCIATGWDFEIRADAFHTNNKKFRHHCCKRYQWIGEYQAEIAKELFCNTYVWANIGYMNPSLKHHRKSDRQAHRHERSHFKRHRDDHFKNIYITPITFGLKQKFSILSYVDVYFGLGASYAIVHDKIAERKGKKQHDKNHSQHLWGATFRAGVHYYFWNCFFADVFADYVYTPVNGDRKHKHELKEIFRHGLGGYKLGGGIGMHF